MFSCHEYNLQPIHAQYIYHKNEIGKPCEKDLPLLKDDITNNLESQKPVIFRYQRFGLMISNPNHAYFWPDFFMLQGRYLQLVCFQDLQSQSKCRLDNTTGIRYLNPSCQLLQYGCCLISGAATY